MERSLKSLFDRVPAMKRPDVYKLVKAHLDEEASAAPPPNEVPLKATGGQQSMWVLWLVLGLTLCNTCACLAVLRLVMGRDGACAL